MAATQPVPAAWHEVLEVMPIGVMLVDASGKVKFANSLLCRMTGYARNILMEGTVDLLLPSAKHGSHEVRSRQFFDALSEGQTFVDGRLTLLRKDLTELAVDIALAPVTFLGATWFVAVIRDDSIRRAHEDALVESNLEEIAKRVATTVALADSEQRFRLAFEGSASPLVFGDEDDRVVAVNDAFCELIGFTRDELIGHDTVRLTHPDDLQLSEVSRSRLISRSVEKVVFFKRYVTRSGQVLSTEVTMSVAPTNTGDGLFLISSVRDVTLERKLATELSLQALHDPLTGLANRALFNDRLEESLKRTERSDEAGAVLLFDLDEFKEINDTYGHLVGDELLVAISKRLQLVTRASDTLCRFGGDEFLYLANGMKGKGDVEDVATRVLGVFSEPFTLQDLNVEQHASIGIVTWRGEQPDSGDLIQSADVALYEAKRRARGNFIVFDQEMQDRATERFELVQSLRQAVDTDALYLNYQPILNLESEEVVGFEALMRWERLGHGPVSPGVFIPLAERSDLILNLDAFALREAIRVAADWTRDLDGLHKPFINVNLSARQFHDTALVETIRSALASNALSPSQLVLEITEGTALSDVSGTLVVLERLEDLGVSVAFDDFGTGFSSLSYLAQMRPRIIKIDQSFVSPSVPSDRVNRLLEAMISLGEELELTVVAEGIETHPQLDKLRELKCELGQGFLFSHAVSDSDAKFLLHHPTSFKSECVNDSVPLAREP